MLMTTDQVVWGSLRGLTLRAASRMHVSSGTVSTFVSPFSVSFTSHDLHHIDPGSQMEVSLRI